MMADSIEYHRVVWHGADFVARCERLGDRRFRVADVPTAGLTPDQMDVELYDPRAPDAAAHFSLDGVRAERLAVERESRGFAVVVAELEQPLPAVQPPVPRFAPRAGDISFPQSLDHARRKEKAIDVADVRETERYWVFPVHRIGCIGVVVEKSDGRATRFGSNWDLDTWIWGYDRGLVTEEPVDLIITAVLDPVEAGRLLDELHIGGKRREQRREVLRELPAVLPASVNWMAIGPLHRDAGRSLRWEARGEPKQRD
jgi:hypothetical protein